MRKLFIVFFNLGSNIMAHLDVKTHIPVIPGMGLYGYMCLWTPAPTHKTRDVTAGEGGGGVAEIQHARGLSNRIHTS